MCSVSAGCGVRRRVRCAACPRLGLGCAVHSQSWDHCERCPEGRGERLTIFTIYALMKVGLLDDAAGVVKKEKR